MINKNPTNPKIELNICNKKYMGTLIPKKISGVESIEK